MEGKLIEIKNLFAKQGGITALHNINITIFKGTHWAILGKSESGKTSLAKAIAGKLFYKGQINTFFEGSIEFVEQQHRFQTLSNTSDFYYQQRFQSQDADDSLTVNQALFSLNQEPNEPGLLNCLQLLRLNELGDKPLIQLSNGENKRFQLAKALLRSPAVLLLDNPFIGLDISGRSLLHEIINEIASRGIHLIIITNREEIPPCITHICLLEKSRVLYAGSKNKYPKEIISKEFNSINVDIPISQLTPNKALNFTTAIRMVNTTVRYGDKIILDNINWLVQQGERWSIQGPNGAGKSTLLSLITADNPQGYANEIYLFGRRRGRGESIWDIKKHIGLVSPEMHLYFPHTNSCFEVIASGLFDTIGLFRKLTEDQEQQVQDWIHIMQLNESADKTLYQLSMGRQRMVLLARALVKNPLLLVLDEPCQGLDNDQANFFNGLVNQLCLRFNTTLIYVSHYQQQLPGCVDNHLYIEEGKLVKKI